MRLTLSPQTTSLFVVCGLGVKEWGRPVPRADPWAICRTASLAPWPLRTNPLQVRGLVAGPPVGQSPRVLRSLRFRDNCRLEKLWHFSESRLHLERNGGVLPVGLAGWGPPRGSTILPTAFSALKDTRQCVLGGVLSSGPRNVDKASLFPI